MKFIMGTEREIFKETKGLTNGLTDLWLSPKVLGALGIHSNDWRYIAVIGDEIYASDGKRHE